MNAVVRASDIRDCVRDRLPGLRCTFAVCAAIGSVTSDVVMLRFVIHDFGLLNDIVSDLFID
jgi:hypothetical protein